MAKKFTPSSTGSRAARPGQTVRGPSGSTETFGAAQRRQRGVKAVPTNRFGPETPVGPEKSFSSRQLAAMDTDKLLDQYADGTRTHPFEVVNVPTRGVMTQWTSLMDEYDDATFTPQTSNVGPNTGLVRSGDRSPAPQSIIPTSTTNPNRPRTLSAGFEFDEGSQTEGTLTVQFRDGTMYNYYGVEVKTWEDFKAAASKGEFIWKKLDSYSRGFASGGVSVGRASLHRAAKVSQQHLHQRRGTPTKTGKAVQVARQTKR